MVKGSTNPSTPWDVPAALGAAATPRTLRKMMATRRSDRKSSLRETNWRGWGKEAGNDQKAGYNSLELLNWVTLDKFSIFFCGAITFLDNPGIKKAYLLKRKSLQTLDRSEPTTCKIREFWEFSPGSIPQLLLNPSLVGLAWTMGCGV